MIAGVYSRKQQRDEPLADFVDSMLAMMANVQGAFDADAQVRIISRQRRPQHIGST